MRDISVKMPSEKVTDIRYKMDTRFKEVEFISKRRKQRLTDTVTPVIVILPQSSHHFFNPM